VPNFLNGLGQGVEGLRIGLPRHFFAEAQDVSPEVVSAIDRAAETLEKLGAAVEEITLPDYELFNACGRVIMYSEAFAIHEQDYQRRPLDFGQLTYLRMTLGAFVTGADLHQAMRLRRELSQAVNLQFKKYDVLITASALVPAPAFADIDPNTPSNLPVQTMPFNVTGNPALSNAFAHHPSNLWEYEQY
jgi:aspartyl-tRNA(Asn)/glutamyl-tRNA(Gln) amidotransferase subunit A